MFDKSLALFLSAYMYLYLYLYVVYASMKFLQTIENETFRIKVK